MWEKLYYKQSSKVISYQKEITQKEQELVMLSKKTTILQLELGQHYDIVNAEKAEKERMICELNKIINKLQENIKIHEADVRQLKEDICTTKKKLSELHHQVNNQHEELCNKDKFIQTLQDEIEKYKVGVHDTKTMAISQMNVDNKMLKSTVRKDIKTTGTRSKVTGFIRKKFLLEKKLPSK